MGLFDSIFNPTKLFDGGGGAGDLFNPDPLGLFSGGDGGPEHPNDVTRKTNAGLSYQVTKDGKIRAPRNTTLSALAAQFFKLMGGDQGTAYDKLLNQGVGVTSNTLSGADLSPDSNPYLQQVLDAIQKQSSEGFNRNLSSLYRGSQGSGNLNSSRTGVLGGRLLRDTQSDLNDKISGLLYGNYATGKQQQLNAVGTAQNLYSQPYDIAGQVLGAPNTKNYSLQEDIGGWTKIVGDLVSSLGKGASGVAEI